MNNDPENSRSAVLESFLHLRHLRDLRISFVGSRRRLTAAVPKWIDEIEAIRESRSWQTAVAPVGYQRTSRGVDPRMNGDLTVLLLVN